MRSESFRGKTLLSAALLFVVTLSGLRPAAAQCILQPTDPGQNSQTRGQNFLTLVNDVYAADFHPTHRAVIAGKTLQVPPWFTSSTDCDVPHLQGNNGMIASPSFSDYLVVSDELSELAVVTALAGDDSRMMEIHNTIQAMASTTYPGLPCWIAEVNGSSLTCRSQDTATDATARFGLAYYYAANNPSFPAASRAIYRSAGDALAAQHLAVEYAHGCYTSPVTGSSLCDWLAGGANTATAGVGGLRCGSVTFRTSRGSFSRPRSRPAIGLFRSRSGRLGSVADRQHFRRHAPDVRPDQLRLEHHRTRRSRPVRETPTTGNRGGPGTTPTLPAPCGWAMSCVPSTSRPIRRRSPAPTPSFPPGCSSCSPTAPRPRTTSCIQYNQNGTAVAGNCGTNYYYNGLGAGLYTYLDTAQLDDKVDTALSQYDWGGVHNWNYTACFGLYRGLRPVKALAAAIGLDAAAYGGSSCSNHTLSRSARRAPAPAR